MVLGGKYIQLWCLILGPLTLSGICSFQDIIQSLPLVPIWVALTAPPEGGILGQIWGSPRYVSLLKKMEIHARKLLIRHLSVLVHLQDVVPLELCLEGEITQHSTNSLWPQSGGIEDEVLTT